MNDCSLSLDASPDESQDAAQDESLGDAPGASVESWQIDSERNETRYVKIMEGSRFPILTLFNRSLKEDTSLLLPRVLLATFGTMNHIPRSLFMHSGPERESYIWDTFRQWSKEVCSIAQIKLDVSGSARIDPDGAYLFVSNHLSPADIPVILAALPVRAGFVANTAMNQIPVMSYWMRSSGAVFVNQGDPKAEMTAFRTMIKRLKRGRSLILFPEGYIHQSKGVAEFKRGGIHSAIFAGVPIVPVCLYGTQSVMRPGGLRIVPRRHVSVEFGEPIDPASLSRDQKKRIESIMQGKIAAMKAPHEEADLQRRRIEVHRRNARP
ncbi:MAG: lysophospholipid acyltransferase family protein [Rectinemataceae bacterium]